MTLGEFLTLCGFLTGGAVLWLESRRRGLNTEGMRLVALAGLLGGVVGAKVIEWVVDGQFWSLPLAFLDPRLGGKAILGGLATGWLAVWIAKRRLGIRRSTGDFWALAIPAGEAVGRWGCFFNGCCYGVACSRETPFAVWQHDTWRIPAQLYSSAAAGMLFLVLYRFDRGGHREGDTWRLFLVLYPTIRFALEFLRDRPLAVFSFSTVQLVCLETVALTMATWRWSRRREGAAAR